MASGPCSSTAETGNNTCVERRAHACKRSCSAHRQPGTQHHADQLAALPHWMDFVTGTLMEAW
eukprot:1162119-Pelagomonas_calceolata.AAC.2